MLLEIFELEEDQKTSVYFWHEYAVNGVPSNVFKNTADFLAMTSEELRTYLKGDASSFPSSAVFMRLIQGLSRAKVAFKIQDQLLTWLKSPQKELADNIPLDLLMTVTGAKECTVVLDKIIAKKAVEADVVKVEEAPDFDENQLGLAQDQEVPLDSIEEIEEEIEE